MQSPGFEAWFGGTAGVLAYQRRVLAEAEQQSKQDLSADDIEHDQHP